MRNIAIFASGEGTNAENIIRYFENNDEMRVALVVYNRKEAGVKNRAERLGVTTEYVPKKEFGDEERIMSLMERYGIDFIVLAGFLLLIPPCLVHTFSERIVNIHPSLMPKHCGKGMYGMNVHKEVVEEGDAETGITIHFLDEEIDHGRIIFQARCKVAPGDTPEDVAAKVHQLEYKYYPRVIECAVNGKPMVFDEEKA